jgi:enterochelin esterase-like enzyme
MQQKTLTASETTMSLRPPLMLQMTAIFATVLTCFSVHAQHQGTYKKNLTYKGPITGNDIIYTLYLPPGHSVDKGTYPLIVFLHGAGGANASAQVVQSYERARKGGKIKDHVIVFPEKYPGTVWRDGARDKMPETNVIKELLPYLEKQHALSTDRGDRCVMGFSMGAAGSLFWGAKYLEKFSVAVALDAGGGSSVTDESARNYVPYYSDKKDALQKGKLAIRLVQGSLNTRDFRASLESLKIPFEYVQIPKETEYYKAGSSCLSRKDPSKKMLHNPACLTEDSWGQNTWAFISKHSRSEAVK